MNKQQYSFIITLILIGSFILYNELNTPKDQFQEWKSRFPITWSSTEQTYRRMVFFNNVAKINSHNADHSQTYKLAINQFSVLTQSQFRLTYLSPKPYNPQWQKFDYQMPPNVTPIDWVQKGLVSKIKNQGNCASGYAFSAVANLQSYALMQNKPVYLSQQQIVDCSWSYQNTGCNFGDNYQSLRYVKEHGLNTQDQYPYIAKNQPCKAKTGGHFKINKIIYAKGCTPMLTALEGRPVGASVDASNWAHYASGVFNNCNRTLNHDVLLVGASDQYWKVKNSWGETWGESGYMRMKSGGTCGICVDKASWPV